MLNLDVIAYHALRQPSSIAVCLSATDVSYETFDRNANQVANRLKERVAAGTRVAVMIDNAYLHWLVLLALGRLGAVSASVDPAKHELLLDLIHPDLVLSDQEVAGVDAIHKISVTIQWLRETLELASGDRPAHASRPEDPLRIVTSSGTTGSPKKILLTHGSLMNRLKGGALAYPARYHERLLSMPGVDTLGGYRGPMRSWWLGGTVCLFSATPELVAGRGPTGIFASPRQLRTLIGRLPPAFKALPNLSVISGGGRMSRQLSQQIRLRLAGDAMTGYASTETDVFASCPLRLLDLDPDLTGIVLPGCEIEALDLAGRTLPPGEVGEIRVRTPEMCSGYFEDEEATARHFRDGWFHPGDLGSVSADGRIRITGRIDDVLNAGGVKIAPDLIEDILMTVPGIRDAGVFSVAEGGMTSFWAAVVSGGPIDFGAAQMLVNRHVASGNISLRFVSVPAVPRNAMGKVQRSELQAQARALQASAQAGDTIATAARSA